MDLRKLKTLIDLVSESGVAELEITEGEDRVRIVNRKEAAPAIAAQSAFVPAAAPAPAPAAAPALAPAAPAPVQETAQVTINSPMVGTFYRSPRPAPAPILKSAPPSRQAIRSASLKP